MLRLISETFHATPPNAPVAQPGSIHRNAKSAALVTKDEEAKAAGSNANVDSLKFPPGAPIPSFVVGDLVS